MQNYGPLFARYYNHSSVQYAKQISPRIRQYYESVQKSPTKKLLDIGCGTGQLALHFLKHGYSVLGIDLSPDMIHYACQNTLSYVQSGYAQFIQVDAADYTAKHRFGLAVSTYDAINHFPNEEALQRCFSSVACALEDTGIFIFDLNTRYGLTQSWNNIVITDTADKMIVNRKIYDGGIQARAQITGFLRNATGNYDRFEEHFFNTVFELDWIRINLTDLGFSQIRFTNVDDLMEDVEDPEKLLRVVVIAKK